MPRTDVPPDQQVAVVDLTDVAVRYGTAKQPVTALEGVDLRIHAGEFVVLVGPSGCGKTSLLRVVAGFERPASGRARVRGALPRPGAGAGVVFQQPRLFPWRTVGGNLGFALARIGVPRAERPRRIVELLERVGLPGMAGRRTWELSGGQQQRVALARALAAEPELLLMDEPFAALDALTRERLQEEVRVLAGRLGMTVLFVTHSAEEAVLLGSRVLVMAAGPGRVVAELPVSLARESDTDVSALRSSPEFARLRGRLTEIMRG
ncbi:ABC transporter ATP-binding protein [Streptomyces virginiae]|uniref:ABC transporter ATP-binding protein n=1 Tax=Streptomyces virginiae TaxID=1961 RepID=UPI002DDB5C5B|nr:ABC transporter ATP-binding protein [Streptomyces virginiae]WSC81180.1 ABC transporter ATP-binding protein [Streptomyces virginiae]